MVLCRWESSEVSRFPCLTASGWRSQSQTDSAQDQKMAAENTRADDSAEKVKTTHELQTVQQNQLSSY